MRTIIRHVCLVSSLVLGAVAHAQAPVSTAALRDFAKCDASFFTALGKEMAEWSAVAPMSGNGEAGWVRVANRNNSEYRHLKRDNQVVFAPTPAPGGVPLLSYFDQAVDSGTGFLRYEWGFTARGRVEEVMQRLRPILGEGLEARPGFAGETEYVRIEGKLPGATWAPIPQRKLEDPPFEGIARSFIVKSDPDSRPNPVVRMQCMLSGPVDAKTLSASRPDIDPKTYPAQPTQQPFDAVALPSDLLDAVSRAAPAQSIWRPKFKRLSYATRSVMRMAWPGKPVIGELQSVMRLVAHDDGSVQTEESHIGPEGSPAVGSRHVSLAGVLPLKSQGGPASDTTVRITRLTAIVLPAALTPGAKLRFATESYGAVPGPQGLATSYVLSCEAKQASEAAAIFPNLTGRAIGLSCLYLAGESHATVELAFLEDLGIVVRLGYDSVTTGSLQSTFVRFDIDR